VIIGPELSLSSKAGTCDADLDGVIDHQTTNATKKRLHLVITICHRAGRPSTASHAGETEGQLPPIDPSEVVGEWVHSHEESAGDRLVFRRKDYPFPPSRGRMSIDLLPGGEAVGGGPGPDDRAMTSPGRWRLEGDQLAIEGQWLSGTYEVETVGPDVLVVHRRG
jgi:hypothetical protein